MNLKYPVFGGQNKISQGFGPSRIDYSAFGLVGHNGIDFYGVEREPILAAADGTVSWLDTEVGGYGKYLMIQHADGSHTIYAHLDGFNVKKGDVVKAGQIIGWMGYTGNVVPAGPAGRHLHFGYRPAQFDAQNGYRGYEDPAPLLEADEIVAPPISAEHKSLSSQKSTVRVCSQSAGVRREPGGALVYYAGQGDEFCKAFESQQKNGLTWQKVYLPVWIAEHDGTDQLLEDI